MADDPETTGTPEEAAAQVAGAEGDGEASGRDQAAAAGEATEQAPPEPPKTPKERRQARRAAAVAKRGPRRASTPEERKAERDRKAAQRRSYRARVKARRAEQPRSEPLAAATETTGARKVRVGIVVSDKADKTITVRIDVARRHRRYQKTIRSSSTLHAHDEGNAAGAGDLVRVIESRPLSRTKRWRLDAVLEKAK